MAIFNSYVSLPEGTNCFFPSTKLRIEPDEPENMGAAAAYPNFWEFNIPCLTHQ